MIGAVGGPVTLPAPPQSVPYSYLHQSATTQNVKFFGAIAIVIGVLFLVGLVATAVQRVRDRDSSEIIEETRRRFEEWKPND